ncbi:MAG TPA: amidase [Gaiellales bacterium]|nr:amidase [Gaiellales bacterium]
MQLERDVLRLSAVDQAALVRAGEISARELVEASLAAIERQNPLLNAFVALCPERALAEAGAVKPGDPRPLCGVPVGIKDLLSATEGLPTTEGSAAFGDWVADHDGAHVRRLREAGAIVVGKTNTPEMGLRPVTENARYGITRNPWGTGLSPGGSSGGSAAAVASGMVALADASDLGGSIRIPASCCGLVGLKPSLGRVSIGPDLGDIGAGTPADCVLTRTVLDTAVALDAVAGHEPGERHHAPAPATSFADAAREAPGRLRVRLCMEAPFGAPVDDEPAAAAAEAARALESLGHAVVEHVPAWEDDSFRSSWSTFTTGACQHLIRVIERLHGRPLDPELLEPATRAWFIDAPPVALVDYLEAAERLWAFGRRIQAGWASDEVLLTPTLTRLPAPAGGMRSQAGVTDDAGRFSALVRIWNVTGQPAVSLPFAETGAGVPVGVQLVGAHGCDDVLLSVAAQLEAAAGWKPAARVAAPAAA